MSQNTSKESIRTDHPVERSADDKLGRADFAKNVGKAILRHPGRHSLVVGILGEWGTGKTSVINMVLEHIREEGAKDKASTEGEGQKREEADDSDAAQRSASAQKAAIGEAIIEEEKTEEAKDKAPIIVEFHPWYFSGQDQLLEQFFKQLAGEIEGNLKKLGGEVAEAGKRIGTSLQRFSQGLRPARHFVPFIGVPGAVVEKAADVLDDMGNALAGGGGTSFDPHRLKAEIAEEIKQLNRKIIIVIDDIDRLTKDEIRQIFQLTKAVADFPNVVYLLSFDKTIVCEALQHVQTGDAERYLEKIIQVPFELPNISKEALHRYLLSNIEEIIGEDFFEMERRGHWLNFLSPEFVYYFDTYREIHRFLNLFAFDYSLLQGEINWVDLVALTAIKSKDNDLYQFIRRNRAVFIGPKSYHPKDSRYQEKMIKNYIAARDSFSTIEIAEPILGQIFPDFAKLLGLNSFRFQSKKEFFRTQGVEHSEYFDRFFSLSVPEGEITDKELQEIIALQDKPSEFAAAIGAYDIKSQLGILRSFNLYFLHAFNSEHQLNLAKAIWPLGERDDNCVSEDFFYFIGELFIEKIESINEQLELYKELFSDDTISPYMMLFFLDKIAQLIGGYSDEEQISGDVIAEGPYGDRFAALERKVLETIKAEAESGALQKHRRLISLLYRWRDIKPDEPKAYVKKLLVTDEGVINFVTSLLSYSYSSKEGQRIPRISRDEIQDFTDEEILLKKVKAIWENDAVYSKLPEKSKEAIEELLQQF